MPECAIGLIPDVGGSLLLARAPGRVGEYLAVTGHRMNGPDAVFAGFADYVIAEAQWPALIAELEASGDVTAIDHAAGAPQHAPLSDQQAWIDAAFRGVTLADVLRGIAGDNTEIADATRATIAKASPLAAACAYDVVARVRATDGSTSSTAIPTARSRTETSWKASGRPSSTKTETRFGSMTASQPFRRLRCRRCLCLWVRTG